MSYPWQYDETIQVGTDYRDVNEVRAYDQRMQDLRDVQADLFMCVKDKGHWEWLHGLSDRSHGAGDCRPVV
jgi:hypothetical protein